MNVNNRILYPWLRRREILQLKVLTGSNDHLFVLFFAKKQENVAAWDGKRRTLTRNQYDEEKESQVEIKKKKICKNGMSSHRLVL